MTFRNANLVVAAAVAVSLVASPCAADGRARTRAAGSAGDSGAPEIPASNLPNSSASSESGAGGLSAGGTVEHWSAAAGQLSGSQAKILFYRDSVSITSACAYTAALAGGALGEVTFVTSPNSFASYLGPSHDWDLVICANQGSHHPSTFQAALVAYRERDPDCGMIISEWSDNSAAQYFPALGFSHQTPWNLVGPMTFVNGGILDGAPPVQCIDAGWLIWNNGTIGGGTVEARGPASGNPMLARSGNLIVNGFLSDTMTPVDNATELVRREIAAVMQPTPSQIRLSGPGDSSSGTCRAVGEELVYDVFVDRPPFALVAGQFRVMYDRTVLDFESIEPGDSPFTSIPLASPNEAIGTILWVSSVAGGGSGTTADSRLARIRFRALVDDCDDSVQVAFDPTFPPILLADGGGNGTQLPLVNPVPVRIDSWGPVLSDVPADIAVAADAGAGCYARRDIGQPTVSDACGDAELVGTRGDGVAMSDPWPCGTTTVVWTASDPCGRTATAMTKVTVYPYHLMDVTVAYAGSGYASSMTRCIDFRIGSDSVGETLTFASGAASATIQVPIGNYSCCTADDGLHSLVSRAPVSIQGTKYVTAVTGADALRNGDLDDDNKIDVIDWGIHVVRVGSSASVNTDCSTAPFHADIDGNGAVTSADGDFILSQFLATGDGQCGSFADELVARSRVTVAELAMVAGADAARADLNRDGFVDGADIAQWKRRARVSERAESGRN